METLEPPRPQPFAIRTLYFLSSSPRLDQLSNQVGELGFCPRFHSRRVCDKVAGLADRGTLEKIKVFLGPRHRLQHHPDVEEMDVVVEPLTLARLNYPFSRGRVEGQTGSFAGFGQVFWPSLFPSWAVPLLLPYQWHMLHRQRRRRFEGVCHQGHE